MKLKEFEGKQLFKKSGLSVPKSLLLTSPDGDLEGLTMPVMLKAQTLTGKRKKQGLIHRAENSNTARTEIKKMFDSQPQIDEILVEEAVDFEKEHYLAITFSTESGTPILLYSQHGGIDIEELNEKNPESLQQIILPVADMIPSDLLTQITELCPEAKSRHAFIKVVEKLYACFRDNDAKLVEINPLFEVNHQFICGDAKVILDDDALFRHDFDFAKRTGQRLATDIEVEAKKINDSDHRGIAGKTFIQLDGDIGVLASGGGASVTAMDALISYDAKPANYTEYSGNPSHEKVKQLTKLTLSLPHLNGLWIVGGIANFTSIYETLRGVMDAIIEVKPTFPIVIRRAGPEQKRAFDMVREESKKHGLDIEIYDENTPLTESAKILIEKVKHYKESNGHTD